MCACRAANNLTGHSFSCKTTLNCGSSYPGRRPLQAVRLDVSFLLMPFFLHESAILPMMESQDCDCAVYDCSFNAMDHAFSSQGTTISSPFSNQLLSLYVQSCFSNSKRYIELSNACDESHKSTQWLNKDECRRKCPHNFELRVAEKILWGLGESCVEKLTFLNLSQLRRPMSIFSATLNTYCGSVIILPGISHGNAMILEKAQAPLSEAPHATKRGLGWLIDRASYTP